MADIYPYVCVRTWASRTATDPIIRAGDQGYLFEKRLSHTGQWQTRISIFSKPGNFHFVPLDVINVSQVKAGDFSIRGLLPAIQQGSIPNTVLNQSTLLDALLSGLLHGIRTEMLTSLAPNMTEGIQTHSACEKTKKVILEAMPKELIRLINKNRCTFAKLWAMAVDEDYYEKSDAGVYLRLYKMPNGDHLVYCGESLQMFKRHKEHKVKLSRDTPGKGYHYGEAYGYTECRVLSLVVLESDTVLLKTAEQIFHMLFQTYAPKVLSMSPLVNNPHSHGVDPIEDLADIQARGTGKLLNPHRQFAMAFNQIAIEVANRVGYHNTCEQMGIKPLNWSSPMAEEYGVHVPWIKTVLSDRTQFRRGGPTKIATVSGGTQRLTTSLGAFIVPWVLNQKIGLKNGDDVYMTFEMMHNGEAHPRSWADFSAIGGWSDWSQIRSLGIRIDWQDATGSWFLTYLSATVHGPLKGSPEVSQPYRKASAVTAALQGIEYINPEPWRTQFRPRMIGLSFDHFHQAFEFQEIISKTQQSSPIWKDDQTMRSEMTSHGLTVARWEDTQFFKRRMYHGDCDSCFPLAPNRARHGHQMCDRARPSCQCCLRKGIACVYSPETGLAKYSGDGGTARKYCDTCLLVSSECPILSESTNVHHSSMAIGKGVLDQNQYGCASTYPDQHGAQCAPIFDGHVHQRQ